MIKKLRVAVDHGNRNMKTCHFIFTTGLTEQDKKPARGEKYLKYQGKYYTLSEKRIPYQRDKTQDSRNRFWILTLFAIAMELEHHYHPDKLTDFLELVNQQADFHYWLFGHYHDSRNVREKHVLLYEQIVKLF